MTFTNNIKYVNTCSLASSQAHLALTHTQTHILTHAHTHTHTHTHTHAHTQLHTPANHSGDRLPATASILATATFTDGSMSLKLGPDADSTGAAAVADMTAFRYRDYKILS